ncbi:MAG TPA: helix-turn-helix transcriptional regulator [Pyrinomonadaceae bacterium]|nr:helix-turn-helix transcriptional regulator [Pyrinomonadaceae bacterium]
MGTNSRERPERLGEKLRQIRLGLGLSQTEMLYRLGIEGRIAYNDISKYEVGSREPTLLTLLRYARAAGVHMEVLVDDELDLPDKLPGNVRHEQIQRAFASRSRARSRKAPGAAKTKKKL